MAVKYKAVARRNPADPTAEEKYYMSVVCKDVTDFNELASLLSDGSTIRKANAYAVLVGLVELIKKELAAGRKVRLGDIGSLSVGVHSEGLELPDKLGEEKIKRRKIVYRAGRELKDMLTTLKFERIKDNI